MKEKIKVNQRIQLNIAEGPQKGNYYSRVEDIIDDGVIVVAAPIEDRFLVPVNVGGKINMLFWDNTAQYAFEAKVTDKKIGSVPTITIAKCSEVQRMQRRSFFRVPARIKIVFGIEKEDEGMENDEEDAECQTYEGWTLNISGGGILLSTNTRLEIGDNLTLEICLPEQKRITALGRVERIDFLSSKDLYRAGIVFVMISENDRDKIVAFVFEKEIELRRKGVL